MYEGANCSVSRKLMGFLKVLGRIVFLLVGHRREKFKSEKERAKSERFNWSIFQVFVTLRRPPGRQGIAFHASLMKTSAYHLSNTITPIIIIFLFYTSALFSNGHQTAK